MTLQERIQRKAHEAHRTPVATCPLCRSVVDRRPAWLRNLTVKDMTGVQG